MNTQIITLSRQGIRRLAAELAIGLALCAGAYMLVVEPLERRLLDTRHEADTLREAASGATTQAPPEKAAAAVARTRRLAMAIEDRSAPARGESEMFGALSRLAESHRIRIDMLQPIQKQGEAGGGPASAVPGVGGVGGGAGEKSPRVLPGDARAGYSISFVAEYADAAAFLGALQTELGFSIIKSGRITPAPEAGSKLVSVVIVTEHRGFDIRALRASLAAAKGEE